MAISTAPSKTELLLACLGTQSTEGVVAALRELSNGDGVALVEEAVRHRVAPLLYHRVRRSPHREVLGDPILERLHQLHLFHALRNAKLFAQLGELLSALRHESIPVIVLKGAHLASGIYAIAGLRPMGDVDLLIRDDDLPRAEQTLRKLGYVHLHCRHEPDYTQHQHLRPFGKPGAVPIEIHRNLAPAGSPFRLDLEGIWSRAWEVEVANVSARVLSPEDLILHLCLHAAYNNRFQISLLQLCDLTTALDHYRHRLDWPLLVAIANQDGRGRFVYCTLSLVQSTLEAEIPSAALESLQHDEADREVIAAVRECILTAPLELPSTYQELRAHEGLREKARLLARSLFPPREELRWIYSLPLDARWVYGYYLLRPLDLLLRRGRVAAEIVLRTRRLQPSLEWEKKRQSIQRWVEGKHGNTA